MGGKRDSRKGTPFGPLPGNFTTATTETVTNPVIIEETKKRKEAIAPDKKTKQPLREINKSGERQYSINTPKGLRKKEFVA